MRSLLLNGYTSVIMNGKEVNKVVYNQDVIDAHCRKMNDRNIKRFKNDISLYLQNELSFESIKNSYEDFVYIGGGKGMLAINSFPVGKGVIVYRIVIIDDVNDFEPHVRKYPSDPKYVKRGRMNREGESLLYVAFDKNVCISEMNCSKKKYALYKYEIIDNINLLALDYQGFQSNNFPEFEKYYGLQLHKIENYMLTMKSVDDIIFNNNLYRLTREIILESKRCSDYIGYIYPSVKMKTSLSSTNYRRSNIAIKNQSCLSVLNLDSCEEPRYFNCSEEEREVLHAKW